MKEQHKEMLKRLKTGEFDERINEILSGKKLAPVESVAAATVSSATEPVVEVKPAPMPVPTPRPASAPVTEQPAALPTAKDFEEAIPILEEDLEEAEPEFDLDDVILSYLMGGDDK